MRESQALYQVQKQIPSTQEVLKLARFPQIQVTFHSLSLYSLYSHYGFLVMFTYFELLISSMKFRYLMNTYSVIGLFHLWIWWHKLFLQSNSLRHLCYLLLCHQHHNMRKRRPHVGKTSSSWQGGLVLVQNEYISSSMYAIANLIFANSSNTQCFYYVLLAFQFLLIIFYSNGQLWKNFKWLLYLFHQHTSLHPNLAWHENK